MTTHTWGTAGTISGLANNQQGNVISQALATMVQGGAAPTTVTTGFASLAGIWWHDTTNNQVKVRDQADTAWILVGSVDETNKLFTAAASGIAAVQGARKNLKLDTRSGNVALTADELILETTGNTYAVARNVSLTISTGTSGANGLDAGTVAVTTWYSVWAIYNGTTVAGLLSTSATAPTLPSGYTYKARVGWVRTNATPALYPLLQVDRRARYVVDGSILIAHRQIAGPNTGNPATASYAAVAWATFAPPTAVTLGCLAVGAGSNGYLVVGPNGNFGAYNDTGNPPPLLLPQSSLSAAADIQLESPNIYVGTSTGGRVCVTGWEDNL